MATYNSIFTGPRIDEGVGDALANVTLGFQSLASRDTYFDTNKDKLVNELPCLVLINPTTVEIQIWRGGQAPAVYDAINWAGSSFQAGLNSILLGYMHSMHSGGNTVFFQNLETKVNWYAVVAGYREYDFNTPQMSQWLGIAPKSRIQSAPVDTIEINGPVDANLTASYADVITISSNESVWGIEVRAGEDYTGLITYTLNNDEATERTKFSKTIAVSVLKAAPIHIHFGHPAETELGSTINVDIRKQDGTQFLVMAGANDFKPWLNLHVGSYRDPMIALDNKDFVNSVPAQCHWGDNYIVTPTSAQASIAPIAVATHKGMSFKVNGSFTPATAATIVFTNLDTSQTVAVLDSFDCNYEFTFDGANWRYIDLVSGYGDLV